MRKIRVYTYTPTALEEPQSDSSPHQLTFTAHAIKASFRCTSKSLSWPAPCFILAAYIGGYGRRKDDRAGRALEQNERRARVPRFPGRRPVCAGYPKDPAGTAEAICLLAPVSESRGGEST